LEAAEYFDIWFDKNRIIFETEMLAEKYFLTNPADAVSIGVGSGLFASKASSVKEMREVIDISFLLSTSSLKSYPEATGPKCIPQIPISRWWKKLKHWSTEREKASPIKN